MWNYEDNWLTDFTLLHTCVHIHTFSVFFLQLLRHSFHLNLAVCDMCPGILCGGARLSFFLILLQLLQRDSPKGGLIHMLVLTRSTASPKATFWVVLEAFHRAGDVFLQAVRAPPQWGLTRQPQLCTSTPGMKWLRVWSRQRVLNGLQLHQNELAYFFQEETLQCVEVLSANLH